MPLPMKVLNRLRLGRSLAARVPPIRAAHCAWVSVAPITDIKVAVYETRYLNRDYQIRGFLIRRVEVEQTRAEAFAQGLLDDPAPPVEDRRLMVSSEKELERLLEIWLPDATALRVPEDAGYWYDPIETETHETEAELFYRPEI